MYNNISGSVINKSIVHAAGADVNNEDSTDAAAVVFSKSPDVDFIAKVHSADVTGPYVVRLTHNHRVTTKVWVLIHLCDMSKALHLKLVENYSGPSLKAKVVDVRCLTVLPDATQVTSQYAVAASFKVLTDVLLEAPKVPMPGNVSTKAPVEAADVSEEIPAYAAVQTGPGDCSTTACSR